MIMAQVKKQQPQNYEPRPQSGTVDWAALGELATRNFPKILAELAK